MLMCADFRRGNSKQDTAQELGDGDEEEEEEKRL